MGSRTIGAFVLLCSLPTGVMAQVDPRDEEARALFDAGAIAYHEGRFADAEDHFRRSYEVSGRVELLYNIAVAADSARHDRVAVEAYEEYLERSPGTDRRSRIETRIAELRRLLGSNAEPEEGTFTRPIEELRPWPTTLASSGGVDPAPWIVVGISAAALIAGAVMVGVALADVSAVESAPMDSTWADYREAYARSEPLSIAGFVLGGVGIAAFAVGIGWGAASGGSARASTAALLLGPSSIALRGTW